MHGLLVEPGPTAADADYFNHCTTVQLATRSSEIYIQ